MPLLALWEANPQAIKEMTIEQVVATAGDGRLRDKSDCSRELREYLSQVQSVLWRIMPSTACHPLSIGAAWCCRT